MEWWLVLLAAVAASLAVALIANAVMPARIRRIVRSGGIAAVSEPDDAKARGGGPTARAQGQIDGMRSVLGSGGASLLLRAGPKTDKPHSRSKQV